MSSDDDDDEEDDDEDDEDDDEIEEVEAPAKKQKLEKPAKQNGVNGKPAKAVDQQQKKQNAEKKNQQPKQEQQKPQQKSTTLKNGVIVQDLRAGKGPEAKQGKHLNVYYEGRMKNGKVFDSTKSGEGFKFILGKGEVIEGWDVGIAGMKVGGKRRIVCPPNAAYGSRGSPPVIPPNSTLTFEIELRGVK